MDAGSRRVSPPTSDAFRPTRWRPSPSCSSRESLPGTKRAVNNSIVDCRADHYGVTRLLSNVDAALCGNAARASGSTRRCLRAAPRRRGHPRARPRADARWRRADRRSPALRARAARQGETRRAPAGGSIFGPCARIRPSPSHDPRPQSRARCPRSRAAPRTRTWAPPQPRLGSRPPPQSP